MFSWLFSRKSKSKITINKKVGGEINKKVDEYTETRESSNASIDDGRSNQSPGRRSLKVTRTASTSRTSTKLIIVADPLKFSLRDRSESEETKKRRGSIFQCELEAVQGHIRKKSQSLADIADALAESTDGMMMEIPIPNL